MMASPNTRKLRLSGMYSYDVEILWKKEAKTYASFKNHFRI